MRKINLFLLTAIFVLSGLLTVQSATRDDLINQLRRRVHEERVPNSNFTDSSAAIWINLAQESVVRLGGFIPKTTKFELGTDRSFALPSGFRGLKKVFGITSYNEDPYPILRNPGFLLDTITMQYSLVWINQDSANLILKMGAAENTDDTIYVEYVSTANVLSYDTSTVDVPSDLIHFIIKESMSYYNDAIGNYPQSRRLWQEVRVDMGIIKPETFQR